MEENIPHRWGIQADFNLNWQRLEGRQRETEGMAGQEAAGQSSPFLNIYTYTYTSVFSSLLHQESSSQAGNFSRQRRDALLRLPAKHQNGELRWISEREK